MIRARTMDPMIARPRMESIEFHVARENWYGLELRQQLEVDGNIFTVTSVTQEMLRDEYVVIAERRVDAGQSSHPALMGMDGGVGVYSLGASVSMGADSQTNDQGEINFQFTSGAGDEATIAAYQSTVDSLLHGLVIQSGNINGARYQQGDLILGVPDGTAAAGTTWRHKTEEEIMATARATSRRLPTTDVPKSPLQQFARTPARRLPVGKPKVATPGVEALLRMYAKAAKEAATAEREMKELAQGIKQQMEAYGVKEVTAEGLVAHFPIKLGNKSRDVDPVDLYKALNQDDEAFYNCVKVQLTKLATYLTEPEIAAITTETPGVRKPAEFAIEPIEKKTT